MPTPGTGFLTGNRQREVDAYGSPDFTFRPGAIATGASVIVGLNEQFPRSRKYQPLDSTEIINQSGENLRIEINGNTSNPRLSPAGTIITITNTPIQTMRFTNESAGNTVQDEITVIFSRAALDSDELSRRIGAK